MSVSLEGGGASLWEEWETWFTDRYTQSHVQMFTDFGIYSGRMLGETKEEKIMGESRLASGGQA